MSRLCWISSPHYFYHKDEREPCALHISQQVTHGELKFHLLIEDYTEMGFDTVINLYEQEGDYQPSLIHEVSVRRSVGDVTPIAEKMLFDRIEKGRPVCQAVEKELGKFETLRESL